VDGLGLELGDWQIKRARAGSERAAELAKARGVPMPPDSFAAARDNSYFSLKHGSTSSAKVPPLFYRRRAQTTNTNHEHEFVSFFPARDRRLR